MLQNIFEPGVVYHVYNRGNNKENLFSESQNYDYFLSLMKKYILPVAEVYGYCLMKNHFHLVLRLKDGNLLTKQQIEKPYLSFSNFFNAYTKAFNKKYNRTGSLFQEHLKRKRINDEEYLIQLIIYVHLNPFKHEFTDNFKNYQHSSYRAFVSNKPTNINKEYILELFGGIQNFEFVHNERILDRLEEIFNDIE